MDGQIRLRWTSHQGTVLSVFDALLASESLVDVTLACEGQYIRAHKVILSACSPYFQDLVNVDLNKHPIFFLKDVKFNEIKALIQYMYRGEVNIAHEELPSLLAVAQALKIRGLADVETANNSLSSDTIILPDLGNKNRIVKQPPPPAVPVPPPPAPVPSVSTSNVARTAPAPDDFVRKVSTSYPTSPILAPVPVPAPAPPAAKKARVDMQRHTTQTQVQKQSQMVDPLADVQDEPEKPIVAPQHSTVTPSTSSQYEPGQDRSFGHQEMVEDAELYGTEMKIEATGGIDEELEEEGENSMSQSSFSESWQMGEGDHSGMADDDGEIPGGSVAANDGAGGADGGEEIGHCRHCGKGFRKRVPPMHLAYDCPSIPARFVCPVPDCGMLSRRKKQLEQHCRKVHPTLFETSSTTSPMRKRK